SRRQLKRTKSSNHQAFFSQNSRKRECSPSVSGGLARKPSAALRSNGSFHLLTASKSMRRGVDLGARISSLLIHACSARRSRLISSGLPAKAEVAEYGE